MNIRKFNVLDLFCGAGGLSLGFQMSGFNIIGGIDFNEYAMQTHKKNFPEGVNLCIDIKTFDDTQVLNLFKEEVDVIVGGPPCQGFSSANQWQSEEEKVEKNLLFYEYMRVVKLLKPKIFVIENVRQILTNNNSYAKNEIMKISEQLGYKVSFSVLNAAEYGVPQKRIRAFIIGVDEKLNKIFNFDKLEKKDIITVKEALSDLYELENKENIKRLNINLSNYQRLMKQNSNSIIYNHEIKYPMNKVQERIKFVPQGGNWKDVPEELWDTQRNNRHSSAYRRLKENDISITIDTGHMNYFHPIFNRVPTVRESARLQSFPDDFVFLGSKTAQFMQVGNAVPPLLAKEIADKIKNLLLEGNNV